MGKHGTLEWLPGKGVGLSSECYPDTFLDDMRPLVMYLVDSNDAAARASGEALQVRSP